MFVKIPKTIRWGMDNIGLTKKEINKLILKGEHVMYVVSVHPSRGDDKIVSFTFPSKISEAQIDMYCNKMIRGKVDENVCEIILGKVLVK